MGVGAYKTDYEGDVYRLWNTSGVSQGYVPMDPDTFRAAVTGHPYFSAEHAFVLEREGKIRGFVCGCEGEDLARGAERGYFTCLLLEDGTDPADDTGRLLGALEDSFRESGRRFLVSNCFNPMKLPWVLPDSGGSVHNNAPGIAVDNLLYGRMAGRGFQELSRECAMYLDLGTYTAPPELEKKKEKAGQEGYHVDWYDKRRHKGLTDMVKSLGNPMWDNEIPDAAERINMLTALKGDTVVGFTGPVYPEETGRGYFAGIAVAAEHEGHGLGTLLFHRLCEEEKAAGAKYMSLFTGEKNPAKKIYGDAGFQVKRKFAVLQKELQAV